MTTLDSTTEWQSACTARPCMLLEGPEAATEAALLQLTPRLRGPIAWKGPGTPFEPPTGECGVLVLRDIATFDGDEQARLRAWLDDPIHHTQVIATTAHPLFPMVEGGLFDEALYYRLNVMLLRVNGHAIVPHEPTGATYTGVLTPLS